MKVSGFSFIRNAIKYDFPIEEAIRSILPLCDDFYVAVGDSEDDTLELIQSIDPKIKIQETRWADDLLEGGRVFAEETRKAFEMIPDDSDWCFCIQADEALHEKYYNTILEAMQTWKDNPEVDGLLLKYLHFYGSYDYTTPSPRWYRREIRIIKNDPSIYPYRDSQGFRKDKNKKLNVKLLDAWMYHYSMVKHPKLQHKKLKFTLKSIYNDYSLEYDKRQDDLYDYESVDILERFDGTHPEVLKARIKNVDWQFNPDLGVNRMSLKNKFRLWMLKHFNYMPWEYRNYKII
jgi:hypothetical protein